MNIFYWKKKAIFPSEKFHNMNPQISNLWCHHKHCCILEVTEAALQRCSQEKVLWKYKANLQENTPCRSVISIKLQSNFIQITFRHDCSPVNLLHIFRTSFLRTPLEGCSWSYTFDNFFRILRNIKVKFGRMLAFLMKNWF